MRLVVLALMLILGACAKNQSDDPGPWAGPAEKSLSTDKSYFAAVNCRLKIAEGFYNLYTLNLPEDERETFQSFSSQPSRGPEPKTATFEGAIFELSYDRTGKNDHEMGSAIKLEGQLKTEIDSQGHRHFVLVSSRNFNLPEHLPDPGLMSWYAIFTDGIKAGDETFGFQETDQGMKFTGPRALPYLSAGRVVECR